MANNTVIEESKVITVLDRRPDKHQECTVNLVDVNNVQELISKVKKVSAGLQEFITYFCTLFLEIWNWTRRNICPH